MLTAKRYNGIQPPDSIIAEEFRGIRTNIYFSSQDQRYRTLLITSPGYNEGKSWTTLQLAASMAQQNDRVLVVDADLRKPVLHSLLAKNKKDNPGLSNFLAGDVLFADCIIPTEAHNVYFLPCGTVPMNPAELIGSDLMKHFIQVVKEQFDVILFDSPPVLGVTDARILSSLCDGVILVIRSGNTKEKAVLETKRLLQFTKANMIGVVLNQSK